MINIEHLDFAVGRFALSNVCLRVEPSEYFVMLGPTGSGKTLLIECLAGLNRIDSGKVEIAGEDVTHVEPRLRRVGYLPQDYALFPHLTVRDNIAFGLGRRKSLSAKEAEQRLQHMMQTVGVSHLEDRLPHKLSGGEKQRVALARALAVEPDVLLLDEPVSALDEHTRDGICRELKRLQRETGTTTIHVCHNFAEMLAVADRVGIIQQGTVLQVGTPSDVLERPASRQVAEFVRAGNLFTAEAEPDDQFVRLSCENGIDLTAEMPEFLKVENQVHNPALEGDDDNGPPMVSAMVRPENIRLHAAACEDASPDDGATTLKGTIAEVVHLGPLVEVTVECKGKTDQPIRLLASLGKNQFAELNVAAGDSAVMSISHADVHVMQD